MEGKVDQPDVSLGVILVFGGIFQIEFRFAFQLELDQHLGSEASQIIGCQIAQL